MTKTMDHSEYPRNLRTKSFAELMYIVRDAREAAEANPEGENVGYYLDEVCYAANEIKRRRG
jgi:hypothetical protein